MGLRLADDPIQVVRNTNPVLRFRLRVEEADGRLVAYSLADTDELEMYLKPSRDADDEDASFVWTKSGGVLSIVGNPLDGRLQVATPVGAFPSLLRAYYRIDAIDGVQREPVKRGPFTVVVG